VMFKEHKLLIMDPLQEQRARPVAGGAAGGCTVKVSNVEPKPNLSREFLWMYFDNERFSSGGGVSDVQLVPEKKKAFVTFNNAAGLPASVSLPFDVFSCVMCQCSTFLCVVTATMLCRFCGINPTGKLSDLELPLLLVFFYEDDFFGYWSVTVSALVFVECNT